jgi:AraC-like DNA-binding protein
MIQFPPGVRNGFPVAVRKLDGYGGPHHAHGTHAHGFFGLMYATSGQGVMVLGKRKVAVKEGSLVITAPGETHNTDGLRGVARWAVDFAADAFGAEGAGWQFPRPSRPEWVALLRHSWAQPQAICVPASHRAQWHRQLETIQRELEERARGYREIARAELKLLLIRTSRLILTKDTPEPVSPLLGEVFDTIESRYSDQLSLSDVARAVARSPAHLTTVVRQQTGMTVQQWIIERRMAEARLRLLNSDENINVVAERVGYGDPTLFIRHFRRAHGVTPRDWRHGTAER